MRDWDESALTWCLLGAALGVMLSAGVRRLTSVAPATDRDEWRHRLLLSAATMPLLGIAVSTWLPFEHGTSVVALVTDTHAPLPARVIVAVLIAIPLAMATTVFWTASRPLPPPPRVGRTVAALAVVVVVLFLIEVLLVDEDISLHPLQVVSCAAPIAAVVLAVRAWRNSGWRSTSFATAALLIAPMVFVGQVLAVEMLRRYVTFEPGALTLVAAVTCGAVMGGALVRGTVSDGGAELAAEPLSLRDLPAPKSPRATALIAALTLLLVGGLVGWDAWLGFRATAQQMTVSVLGQTTLASGQRARFRVQVQHESSGIPIEGARVSGTLTGATGTVALVPVTTDTTGTVVLEGDVPADADLESLHFVAEQGLDRAWGDVAVEMKPEPRNLQVLLTTDKPRYQPGQVLHVRALVLGPGLRPAAQLPITLSIANATGVRVLHRESQTSAFGIAVADLELAEGIDLGAYEIVAAAGGTHVERKVEVAHYELPRFRVSIGAAPFTPREPIPVTVFAEHLFGEPVVGADVELKLTGQISQSSGESLEKHLVQRKRTDKEGRVETTFPWLAGERAGLRAVQLTARVSGAGIGEQTARRTLVPRKNDTDEDGASAVRLQAFPERVPPVRLVENRIFVTTTNASGDPVSAALRIGRETIHTSRWGVATITRTPDNQQQHLIVRGRVDNAEHDREIGRWPLGRQAEEFLLRPRQTYLPVGGTLELEALASSPGPVFVDVVKRGQVVQTTSIRVSSGRGEARLELDPSVVGMVQLNGYRRAPPVPTDWTSPRYRSPANPLVEDVRWVQVGPALDDLEVDFSFGRRGYRPGERAEMTARVHRSGAPTRAALGLVGIDEAVLVGYPLPPGNDVASVLLGATTGQLPAGLPQFPSDILLPTTDPDRTAARDLVLTTMERDVTRVAPGRSASERRGGHYFSLRRHRRGAGAALALAGLTTLIIGWLLWQTARRRTALGAPLFAAGVVVCGAGAGSLALAAARNSTSWESQARMEMAENREGGTGTRAKGEEGSMGNPATNKRYAVQGPAESASFQAGLTAGPAPPLTRRHFPETLFWLPEVVTDRSGTARVEIPLADSITTWQIAGTAVSPDGGLAAATTRLRVSQEFFTDLRLPPHLTVGDTIAVPVSVFNYLDTEQPVRLELAPSAGLSVLGPASRTVRAKSGQSHVTLVRLRADAPSAATLQVTATGASEADAIERATTIHPNGGEIVRVQNRVVTRDDRFEFRIPESALDGSAHARIKVYPSRFSQIVEGLYGVFEMPHGCFEQTSSTTYPSVLALRLLRQMKQARRPLIQDAERYIAAGYQRLVSFEVERSGGFSLFGSAPASVPLTAYGLMEFTDMDAVHPVDSQLVTRTREFLLDQQTSPGAWDTDPSEIRLTAYVTWALAEAGVEATTLAPSLDRIARVHGPADDPYRLALRANALLAGGRGPAARPLVDQLARLDPEHVEPQGPSVLYSSGRALEVETVALATLALKRSGAHAERADTLIRWLIHHRDSEGTWATTSATVAAMRALLQRMPREGATGQLAVALNDAEPQVATVHDDTTQHQQLVFDGVVRAGSNTVYAHRRGEGEMHYQLVSSYHAPWTDVERAPAGSPLSLTVKYAPTAMNRSENVTVTVRLEWTGERPADMPLIQVGIPPGMAPNREALDGLSRQISRYTVGPRHVAFYLEELRDSVEFRFEMTALHPMSAQAPPSYAYLYYEPEIRTEVAPVLLTVR